MSATEAAFRAALVRFVARATAEDRAAVLEALADTLDSGGDRGEMLRVVEVAVARLPAAH